MADPRMSDDAQYAVYLHEGALDALGEAVKPYLSQGPYGPHFLCTDLDTGGALVEMQVRAVGNEPPGPAIALMFPVAIVRLVMEIAGLDERFGFGGS